MRKLNEHEIEQLLTIRDILDLKLKDDYTESGGISHIGETVGDFVVYTSLKLDDSIAALNRELKICGLCPILFDDYKEIAQEKIEEKTIKMVKTFRIRDVLSLLLKCSEGNKIVTVSKTVGDFAKDLHLSFDTTLPDINVKLLECGFLPISFGDIKYIIDSREQPGCIVDEKDIIEVVDNITVNDIMRMLEKSDKLYYEAINDMDESLEGMFNTMILKAPDISDVQISNKEKDYPLEPCITYIEGDKIDESKMIPISWLTEIGVI